MEMRPENEAKRFLFKWIALDTLEKWDQKSSNFTVYALTYR